MDISRRMATSFCDLPKTDVIAEKIFIYLSVPEICQLRRVSRSFYQICSTYFQFCTKLNFSTLTIDYPNVSRPHLVRLLKRNKCLQELSLKGCEEWFCVAALANLLPKGVCLRTLDLSDCRMDESENLVLFVLAQCCPGIEELDLGGCSWLSAEAVMHIGTKCRSIRKLSLRSCDGVDDECMEVLLKNNLELTELNLRYCRKISQKTLNILQQCTGLRRLDFSRCCWVPDSQVCGALFGGFKQLVELNLTHTQLSGWAVEQIGQSVTSLEKIMLAGLSTVNDENFSIIVENNKQLVHVDLSLCRQIGEKGIVKLAKSCSKLRTLSLSGCIGVTNTAIKSIAQNCSNLREINLEECEWLTDDALIEIAKNNHQLRTLSFANSLEISDKGLVKLFDNNCYLESVNIANCCKVTASSIKQLALVCSKLTHLIISKCLGIKDREFCRLVENFQTLEFVDMEECSWVSSKTIATLGMKCRRLTSVNFSNCIEVNCRSLYTLLMNSARLRYVDASECSKITNSAGLVLSGLFPRVHLYGFDEMEDEYYEEKVVEKENTTRISKCVAAVQRIFGKKL